MGAQGDVPISAVAHIDTVNRGVNAMMYVQNLVREVQFLNRRNFRVGAPLQIHRMKRVFSGELFHQ